jgi:isomaltose glucohydrolase
MVAAHRQPASVPLDDDRIDRLVAHSIRLIRGLQHANGAYPASPTFSAYVGFCWLRDGSFIADGMSAAGEVDSASRFFEWCGAVIESNADTIRWIVAETQAGRPPTGARMLPARFTMGGRINDDDWWDFQLDGYGTWLWALVAHVERHGVDPSPWRRAAALTVDYLVASWERPCFDWWEEHATHVHVSTLACIAAGLEAVARIGLVDAERAERALSEAVAIRRLVAERGTFEGHLIKWLDSDAMDGSLAAALAPLGFVAAGSPEGLRTLELLDTHLVVGGGMHRYLGDTFFGGGQWPLLSCFHGLAHLAAGHRDRAEELLAWAASTATDGLDLPEQVGEHLIAPGMVAEWVERWGSVATPLLWSHAMFLRLAAALGRIPGGGSAADG